MDFSLKADTQDDHLKASEDEPERTIRLTVFPKTGGRPYLKDVDVDEEGKFELNEGRTTYTVAPNSVWQEGTTMRAILFEARTQTISVTSLEGSDVLTPQALHGIANNNLWAQLDEINKRKSMWKQTSTWIMIGLAGIALLLMFWQIKVTGDGMESLEQAIRQAKLAAENANGHQPIAPGGN